MKFLEYYIGSIILWSIIYIIGKILFDGPKKVNVFKLIIIILVFSLALTYLNLIDSEIFAGILKIICVYTLQCMFYKIIFKDSISKSMIIALVLYLCLCVSEVIVALMASLLLSKLHPTLEFLKNTIIINFCISFIELAIIKIFKKPLLQFTKNNNFNTKTSSVLVLVILITIALLIFKIPVTKWKFDLEFIITMSILLCFCIIGLFLLKQRSDIQKTTFMYQQLVSYSNITNKLLEDYRVVSHEHKNQLSIIRGMLDDTNQELITYIDNLLNKRNIIKYQWATQLNNLPIAGLKGLLNYKLIEMESEKIKINISISKEVSKTKLNKLDSKQTDELYSIMGIYLDNAIQAAAETKKKEISIEIFKDQKDLVIIIANTYKNKINLDKIDDYGYTTKGKNHGVGLHIAKNILEESKLFTQNRKLFEDYYVQELRIHLSEIISKRKK